MDESSRSHHHRPVSTPQGGIFALGTSSHAYLEFDLREGVAEEALASALAGLREPRTTMGGVNLVMGFRPTLWRALQPDAMPEAIEDFDRDVVGPDDFTMPATQHDAVVRSASLRRRFSARRLSRSGTTTSFACS